MTLQFAGAQRRAWVSTDKPGDVMQLVNGDLEIQPVDIEHIDKYYFGAMPDENDEGRGRLLDVDVHWLFPMSVTNLTAWRPMLLKARNCKMA